MLNYAKIRSRYKIIPVGDRLVTFRFRRETVTTVSGSATRINPDESRQAFSQVSLDGTDVTWRVASKQLKGNKFATEDEIVDGNETWTVKSAQLALSGNEWRLVTGKQR